MLSCSAIGARCGPVHYGILSWSAHGTVVHGVVVDTVGAIVCQMLARGAFYARTRNALRRVLTAFTDHALGISYVERSVGAGVDQKCSRAAARAEVRRGHTRGRVHSMPTDGAVVRAVVQPEVGGVVLQVLASPAVLARCLFLLVCVHSTFAYLACDFKVLKCEEGGECVSGKGG